MAFPDDRFFDYMKLTYFNSGRFQYANGLFRLLLQRWSDSLGLELRWATPRPHGCHMFWSPTTLGTGVHSGPAALTIFPTPTLLIEGCRNTSQRYRYLNLQGVRALGSTCTVLCAVWAWMLVRRADKGLYHNNNAQSSVHMCFNNQGLGMFSLCPGTKRVDVEEGSRG